MVMELAFPTPGGGGRSDSEFMGKHSHRNRNLAGFGAQEDLN